jgi:hypothetical protein
MQGDCLSMALQPFVGPRPLFQFLDLLDGRTPWTRDQPVARPLPAHRIAETQNKRTQTSTPQVGFEPAIPVFHRAKKVHALNLAATVIGLGVHQHYIKLISKFYDIRLRFHSRQWQDIFLYFTASRPALGSTQPPSQWERGLFSRG